MKVFKFIAAFSLFAGSLQALGFGVGPFDLNFAAGWDTSDDDRFGYVSDPICSAIENQKKIEVIVKFVDQKSDNELKIIKKRLTVEPYAFGFNNDHQPILQGNVVSEKMVKEVTIKYGDEEVRKSRVGKEKKNGFFSGMFKSKKNDYGNYGSVNIQRIGEIRILEDSHFDVPKDFEKNFADEDNEMTEVVCKVGSRKAPKEE